MNISFFIKKKSSFFFKPYGNLVLQSYEHLIELRERCFQFIFLTIFICFCFLLSLNVLADLILKMIPEVQFFQLSPQDFFLSTFLNSLNFSLIFSVPNFLRNLIFFFTPSFLLKEKKIIFPLVFVSLILSFLSISFCYFSLAPVTFNFFLDFNSANIEPFWSFRDFSGFFFKLLYVTLLLFQLPILQILGKILGFWSLEQMVKGWKIIILLSFLLGGIVTPSTDPFTQVLLSFVICLLYSIGIFFAKNI